MLKSILVSGAVALTAASAEADTLSDTFSSFWVLGDSLSDTGRIGRFTDGLLWEEPILAEFTTGASLAYAGAIAGDYPASYPGPVVPNVVDQTDELLTNYAADLGSDPLVALWFGGNDVRASLTVPGFDAATSFANTLESLTKLVGAGVSDFLVINVPDLGITPLVQSLGLSPIPAGACSGYPGDPAASISPATCATFVFNAQLEALLAGFEASVEGVDITRIDAFGLSQAVAGDLGAFGLESYGPCTILQTSCDLSFFWDGFHPTSAVHAIITEEVRGAYDTTPVPLPAAGWLLIGGLGAVAALRRRAA